METPQATTATSSRAVPAPRRQASTAKGLLLSLLSVPALVSAQSNNCISLEGSTMCPAFESASISTSGTVADTFSFLSFVSDRESFDEQLRSFTRTAYVQEKYQTLFGCGDIDLTDTDELYSRFTTSVICNVIVQLSIDSCDLENEEALPLCAETCAQFARSEALLVADEDLCSDPTGDLNSQVRADFFDCAIPVDSLSSSDCIQGIENEPENCGYGNSTLGMCSYCGAGGINSTDTCCFNSDAEERCADVTLPSVIPSMTFPEPSVSPSPTQSPGSDDDDEDDEDEGLSGGAIAGIVVGSIAGALLIAGLIFLCIMCLRRRRGGSQNGSVFNQPSPSRKGEAMESTSHPQGSRGYEILPGGRIARMSALESTSEPAGHDTAAAAAAGAGAGHMADRSRRQPSSSDFGSSPDSDTRAGRSVLRPPLTNIRRNGSLSSSSVLAGEYPQSPTSAGGMSSPQGVASQQSEQLPFFRDYYSSDDIHPSDRVSVLWAYQPRAPDEFALERGDMLKVVGIWDDGWATGVMLDERADEWESRRGQRDSGVSNTSGRERDTSPPVSGEIKAFPLVCVCLPEHWRKTIEGDGSTETASSAGLGS